jgi:hypothetical protein
MRNQQVLLTVIATVSLLGSPLVTKADDGGPPPQPGKEFCKENPGKCEEARARHREFCQANPDKCEQMKDKRAERREYCKANPEKCKEQREQMQAKCKADPSRCEEMKDQARKKFQDWMGGPPSPTPPTPPPAAPPAK